MYKCLSMYIYRYINMYLSDGGVQHSLVTPAHIFAIYGGPLIAHRSCVKYLRVCFCFLSIAKY